MTHEQIIAEIKSMGGYRVTFHEDGRITAFWGRHTINTYRVINGELKNVACRTTYLPLF